MARVKYSEELAHQIIDRMIDGESLRAVCASPGMPHRVTVVQWAASDHEGFGKLYAAAFKARSHVMVEDAIEISDDGRNDWMHRNDPNNPGYEFNGEHFQRSRLRVDTRKWAASRLNPATYGDKQTTEISGPAGGAIKLELEDSTPSIRLLLQQALPVEAKTIEAEEADAFQKTLGGRPRLSE